jgi:UDP-glucose 4-epimerase
MVNVLVTGGAGYIGSHCCKELHNKGYNPITFDNLVYGHRENVKWGDFYKGDIGNVKDLKFFFKKYKIDAVIHFAAYTYAGESIGDPQKYYLNNLQNTINLLRYLLKNDISHFIFSSTCATYGSPNKLPIDEGHLLSPINPYGRSKKMIEEILEDYNSAYGLNFISLRYFNAAGADSDREIGENHNPETHLIPLVLDVAIGKRKVIQVFGTDYDTKDGSCVRDYVHVSDLANAHVLALEMMLDGSSGGFFNLGTGCGYSVLEVIEKVSKITRKEIPFIVTNRRCGDPPILLASNEKAVNELGWKPKYNSLEDIIRTAWNWHKSIGN